MPLNWHDEFQISHDLDGGEHEGEQCSLNIVRFKVRRCVCHPKPLQNIHASKWNWLEAMQSCELKRLAETKVSGFIAPQILCSLHKFSNPNNVNRYTVEHQSSSANYLVRMLIICIILVVRASDKRQRKKIEKKRRRRRKKTTKVKLTTERNWTAEEEVRGAIRAHARLSSVCVHLWSSSSSLLSLSHPLCRANKRA